VWEDDGSKLSATLDPSKLWLLEEGHCLSNQITSICNLNAGARISNSLTYQTGSLETIVRMADLGFGQTIIPQMFVDYLDNKSKEKVHPLPKPTPIREVSLVHRKCIKVGNIGPYSHAMANYCRSFDYTNLG
jgi:LysR family hydrogen peroxide-inducible transcriptional activator